MARKPKVIEIPGDTAPAVEQAVTPSRVTPSPNTPAPTPLDPAAPVILERRCGWVLVQGLGWCKEGN